MGNELPNGAPISGLTFDEFSKLSNIKGYIYPKRNVSRYISLMTKSQQLAINFYFWLSLLVGLAGLGFPVFLGSWWWGLLLVLAWMIWKANRKSVEDFFLEQLKSDRHFYEVVAKNENVQIVLK